MQQSIDTNKLGEKMVNTNINSEMSASNFYNKSDESENIYKV